MLSSRRTVVGIDLSPEGIDDAAGRIENAATSIEDTRDAPGSIDAGEMSPLISTILSGVTRSTGVIVDEVRILAANARVSAADYRETDGAVAQSFVPVYD